MFCAICQNDLYKCTCSDLKERLSSINKSSNIISRVCAKCKEHYAICKCENPEWTTSDKLN